MDQSIVSQKALTTYKHPVSTLLHPNVKGIIYAFGCFIHENIEQDNLLNQQINPNSLLYFFNEEKYFIENPDKLKENAKEILFAHPSIQEICEFIELLQRCGKFRSECLVISIIYIMRLKSLTGVPISVTSWRPLILCSVMLAQKIWEDKQLASTYFAFVHPFMNADQVNKLEKVFLELIEYNVTIKMSIYVRYYFELRSRFQSEFDFGLDEDQLKTFENKSTNYKEALIKTVKKNSLTH